MGGAWWAWWPPALAGALLAASVWLFLGWEAEDRLAVLSRIWDDAARLAHRMGDLCMARLRRMGVQVRASRPVGLGEVSEMIDIIRLGLTAGLSFDAALGLYCDGRSGGLATSMERALISWQSGLSSREDELMVVARDLGVQPLEVFAVAVSQALELGAPLAETLKEQGEEIRSAHRAEVERRIEQAPVKLLIPTGTLILPALLLSILGPLLAAGGMI